MIDAEASAEAVALAELLDMALVPSYGHNDVVPNSHRLYVGAPGGGEGETAEAMHRADVILALGTRLNQSTTLWNYNVINPQKHALCRWTLRRRRSGVYPVAVGIVGDAKAVAQQLLQSLRDVPGGPTNPEWRAAKTLAARRRDRLQAESTPSGEPMMPQRVYPELRKAPPRDCMVTIDAGITPGLATIACTLRCRGPCSTTPATGGIGVVRWSRDQTGAPRPPCREPAGRRGIPVHVPGTEYRRPLGHPLVSIVLNNGCHGAEKAQQQRFYDGRYIGVDLVNPRFDKLAEVYGARGFYVSRPDEIADAVVEALAVDGPSVIEIPVAEYFPLPAPHQPARVNTNRQCLLGQGYALARAAPAVVAARRSARPHIAPGWARTCYGNSRQCRTDAH